MWGNLISDNILKCVCVSEILFSRIRIESEICVFLKCEMFTNHQKNFE